MKNLLILTVLLAVANAQTAERNGRAQPRAEIIIPSNTNLFLRTSPTTFVFRASNDFSSGSFNRTNVIAGSTNRLNSVGLTNSGLSRPTGSVLIGPVFPGPATNLFPTGRSTGFEGLGPGPELLVTNAFGQFATNSVFGTEVPGPSVPATPPNTTPLAPPTAPSIPQPTTPSAPPDPNAPPATPSSPNPTTPNSAPLAPPNTQSLPPTPPAPPPPAAPGGGASGATPR